MVSPDNDALDVPEHGNGLLVHAHDHVQKAHITAVSEFHHGAHATVFGVGKVMLQQLQSIVIVAQTGADDGNSADDVVTHLWVGGEVEDGFVNL